MSNRFKDHKSKYILDCTYSLSKAIHNLHQVKKDKRDNSHEYEVLEAVHHDVYVFMYDTYMMDSNDILKDTSLNPPINLEERNLLEEMHLLDIDMQHANALLLDGENPRPYPAVIETFDGGCTDQAILAIRNVVDYGERQSNNQPNK